MRNKITTQYVSGFKKAYIDNGAREIWEHFETIKHGSTKEDMKKLRWMKKSQIILTL